MSRVFTNIEFTASPIIWCKKNIKNKGAQGHFWLTNENCTISNDIRHYNITEICPMVIYIIEKYPNSEIEIQDSDFAKHISITVGSFVKRFQHVKKAPNRTYFMVTQSQNEIIDMCLKCKNSKHM